MTFLKSLGKPVADLGFGLDNATRIKSYSYRVWKYCWLLSITGNCTCFLCQ